MNAYHSLRTIGRVVAVGALLFGAGCSSDDGGINTPLTPTLSDGAPPLAPSGLEIRRADHKGCAVRWSASAEADLVGYNVYLYDPDPSRTSSYVAVNTSPVAQAAWVLARSQTTTAADSYFLRVSAVDSEGHESALSEALEVRFGSSSPDESSEQDPGVGGDEFTDYDAGGGSDIRDAPGVPGRNPGIEQPGRR